MKTKSIALRELAQRDVDEVLEHYVGVGGEITALDFIDAVESAFRHICAHPGSGSPRYAIELDLPDVRSWRLKRFPYLIFISSVKRKWTSGAYCMGRATSPLGSTQPSNANRPVHVCSCN